MKINGLCVLFAACLVLFTAVTIYPNGPGSLDLTFAGTGYKIDGFGDRNAFGAVAAAIQPDGKIVAVARWFASYGIARYNADGTPDPSFGTGGKVLGPTSEIYILSDMAFQPDGKIVIVGAIETDGIFRRFALFRHNPDGSLDTSFDGDGAVSTLIPGHSSCAATSVAIQSDGKIVATGYAYNFTENTYYLAMVRYNADGSVDTTFDSDGIAITPNINALSGNDVMVQPDGKILVGGSSSFTGGTKDQFAVARYNTNGSIDTTFGGGLVKTTMLPDRAAYASAIALMPDGRIIAAGRTSGVPSGDINVAIARYNPDGSLDTTFDGDGKFTTSIGSGSSFAGSIVVQADGKIVGVGYAYNGSNNDIALLRLNPDGSFDSSYGIGGKTILDLGANESASGIALDSAGKTVIVGTSGTSMVTARFTSEAAPLVDVGGRVISTNGQGIGGATVVLTNAQQQKRYALTNAFGYYAFPGVSSNEEYTVNVSNKRYRFQPSSRSITLLNSIADVDFTGNPGSESLSGDNSGATLAGRWK